VTPTTVPRGPANLTSRPSTPAPAGPHTVVLVAAILLLSALVGATGAGLPAHSAAATARSGALARATPVSHPGRPTPASSGVGSVVDTLDLATNQLLPGNPEFAVGASPQMVLFDPADGNFFVRAADGESISVVNASTDTVLTAIAVGTGGSAYIPNVATMALDSATGVVFETNPSLSTVGLVQASSNSLIGAVSVGGSPGGIVFDPANGNLYTSNWINGTVTVISGASETVVTTIPVGREPGAILYDPVDREVYVSNFDSGNVSIINTTNEAVVANPVTGITSGEPVALALDSTEDRVFVVNSITSNVTAINGSSNSAAATFPVGSIPTSATYSPSTDTLLVANGASNNVTVVQEPGDSPIASIPIGHGAEGAAEDPVNGYVYLAAYGANAVNIVDPANDTVVGTVTTGNFPEDLGVDSSSGEVYVGNLGTANADANLTVLSGSTSVGSIDLVTYPTSLTAAPNGNVYAIDHGGSDAYVLDATTNLATGVLPAASAEPVASAFDSASGDLYIASEGTGTVNVVTGSGGPVATIDLGFGSEGLAYDAANGNVYVSNYYSGNVTVIQTSTESVTSVFTVVPFDSLGAELYDPADSSVYIADYTDHNVTVVRGNTTSGSIQVGTNPTGFAYDPENDTIFVANYGSGNISVVNASTDRVTGTFPAYFPEYLAYDAATNALYVASAENGQVLAFNATTYASLGPALAIQDSAISGGIAYSATSREVYVSNELDSAICIVSTVNATLYPVNFTESGLPPGTTWGVTFGGVTNSSSASSFVFEEPNGSYSFTVADVPGYTPSVASGLLTVAGAGLHERIAFTAVPTAGEYPLTFNETGLPQGTSWSVAVTPTPGSGSPTAEAPASIVLETTNGTYDFTVPAVSGYASSPSSGAVTVTGAPEYRTIAFTSAATGSPLTASLALDPTTLTEGGTTTLTTTAGGGSAGYSYAYSGLPAGCTTVNASELLCTPTATGNFTIVVNVTDATGSHALAHADLQVSAPAGNSASGGSTNLVAPLLGALLVIVIVLVAFFWWRRRKKSAPNPEAGAGGAAVPSPGPTGSDPR
jgi:YVTN family beta-propeller protein